ncbi:rhomboid family intramembrane serine protease [Alkalihalophilus pseudofirmus]|uniref:rhomboid family protein n=1 Tax=Alkalihalophilus pseudofirmus TaxID=79885 RepID=UPI000950E47B|nr:rhomboid family intramembrane serine protease [Alkalihalophilus pseudofirmus]
MSVWKQDLYFWQLVHHYVTERGFRLLYEKNKEVWLEDENSKPKRIIRIARRDFDWQNQLRKDVTETVKRAELLRKQLKQKKIAGENIYISMYPPVDSWDDLTRPFYLGKKQQTMMKMVLIPSGLEEKRSVTSGELSKDLIPAFPIYEDIDMAEVVIGRLKREVRQHTKKKEEEERSFFLYGKPIATYVLLIMIAVMFYIIEQNGGSTHVLTLIEFGAKYNPAILDGEWWRFFSSMFLHIGFIHLFMNSLALFYLGGAVERMYGTSRFVLIYFIAGLIGSISSFAFNEQVAAGASGAIFGLFGALLYFGTAQPKLFFRTMGMNVLVILGINLVFGFVMPMIDNGAHIGGLVGGFLAAALVQLPKEKGRPRQIFYLLGTIILALSLFWLGHIKEDQQMSSLLSLQLAQEYMQEGRFDEAYPLIEAVLEEENDNAEAYFLMAYLEYEFGQYEKARESLLKTVELRPSFHEAHYNLALTHSRLGNTEEAIASLEEAIALAPEEEDYQALYDDIMTD